MTSRSFHLALLAVGIVILAWSAWKPHDYFTRILEEWWVALASGTDAEAFLATQGDIWDMQWDMFLALCGAVAAQLLLSRWHDGQLARTSRLLPGT